MQSKQPPLLVLAYYGNSWCAKPFKHLLDKFYNDRGTFILLSDGEYIDSDVFIKHGGDRWERDGFGAGLKKALDIISEDHVLLMYVDYFILRPVRPIVIEVALDKMKREPDIFRIQMGNSFGQNANAKLISTTRGVDFYECPDERRDCFHPASLTPGLWKKDWLEGCLVDHQDSWNVEEKGFDRFRAEPSARSLGIWPEPIDYENVIQLRNNNNAIIPKWIYSEVKHWVPNNVEVNQV